MKQKGGKKLLRTLPGLKSSTGVSFTKAVAWGFVVCIGNLDNQSSYPLLNCLMTPLYVELGSHCVTKK